MLHGAFGIPEDDLAKASRAGVGNVNFNTELRTGVLPLLESETSSHRAAGKNLLGLLGLRQGSVGEFTTGTLKMLRPQRRS